MTQQLLPNEFEYADPDAKALSQSLRAFGYDISTAIADLIDNSITAGAHRIDVNFEWNDGEPWVAVIDDGCGMTEERLYQAMKPGSSDPLEARQKNDLGRFGLGLKTASFSQCRKVTVITKTTDTPLCLRAWDLDLISENNRWILLKTGSPASEEITEKYLKDSSQGTIVLWEKLDRIVPAEKIDDEDYQNAFLDYAHRVKEHISVIFSGYMQGQGKIKFFLNGNAVAAWDPFAINNPHTTYQPLETLYVNGKPVKVQASILPHQSWLNTDEYISLGGSKGWTAEQGFYIYRNNRLIVEADWLIPGMQKKEQYKLARIRIDIGNDIDSEWNIDVKKSVARPPVSIQKEIRRIAIAAQRKSAEIYRHRGKKIARQSKTEQAFVWHENYRNGKLGYSINRDHPLIKEMLQGNEGKQIKTLLELIEETIPVPTIISDYSDHSDEMLKPYEGKKIAGIEEAMEALYTVYTSNGASPSKAISMIAGTEPFVYAPDQVELFKEKKGIKDE